MSIDTPLQLTKEVTFSVWFMEDLNNPQESYAKIFALYPDPSSSNDRIFVSKNVNAAQYYFKMHDGTNIKSVNFPVQAGEWNFLCVSIKEDGTWVVFHNGDMQVLPNYLAPDTALLYNSVKIGIHARDGGGFHFHGKIDELAIFNRALSATEIEELYANGLSYTTEAATTTPAPEVDDFSCDAGLVMRYAFDDPANPGIDSVSGSTAGVTGTVTIQDNAYAEFDSATSASVRMQPFTVAAGDDVTFSWWMRPDSAVHAQLYKERGVFQIGSKTAVNQIRWRWLASDATVWYPQIRTSGTWASLPISGVQADVWSFVMWRIRADGYWSVIINDEEKYSGVQHTVGSLLYDDSIHHIGISQNNPTYPGGLRDFRLYRSFLSDEQVAAVRAGGPATACATSDSGNVDESSLLVGGDPESNEYFSGAVDDVRLYEVQLSDGDVAVISLTTESETAVLNPVNFSTECVNETNIVFQTPFDNIDFMASMGSYGLEYFGNFDGVYYLDHESDPPRHQCAVLKNGSLGCWGDNSWGQSGGVFEVGEGLQEVCVGAHHSCYLQNYAVTCFGSSMFNQTTVPLDLGEVRSIACGSRFTCALLLSNDEVRCWGDTDNKTVAVNVIPNASACGQPRRVYGEVRIRILSSSAPAITSTSMPETLVPLLSDFFFQVAGIGDAYLEVVPRFSEAAVLEYMKVRLFDDGEQGLAWIDNDISTASLQNYLTQVQSEYSTSEVLFFNFTTRGAVLQQGANELHSYADAFIAMQVDSINVSSMNALDLLIDSAIAFNFLTVSEGAEEKYREILSLVSGGGGFDISSNGELQIMTPRLTENGISCLEVTEAGTYSLSDFSCIWRYLVLNNTVTSVAAESLYLYKGGEETGTVKNWIIENSLGSVNEVTSSIVDEYFSRACSSAVLESSNENSLACAFFDPGFRWISRLSQGGLDPYTLSDKTILVVLASLKDRNSGQVVRRRLLAVDPHASSKESGFGFEFTQVNPKLNLAALSNARKKWQYVDIEARMSSSMETGVFLSNARLVLSSVRRKLSSSIESIQIVSTEYSRGNVIPSRRLLQHTTTGVNLTTIFKLEDFNTFVYKDLLECLFFELSGNATLLDWEMAQDMVETCSAVQKDMDSALTNLSDVIRITLQDCGGNDQEFEEAECMRLVGRLYKHFSPMGIDWYYIRGHFPHSSFSVRHGVLRNDTAVLMDYIRENVAFIFSISPSRVVAQPLATNSTMIWIYADDRLPYTKASQLYLRTDLDAIWRGKLPDLLEAFSSLTELKFEGFHGAIQLGGPSPIIPVSRDDYFVLFVLRIPFTQLSYRQAVAFEKSAITVLSREVGMSFMDIYVTGSSTYAWHTLLNFKMVFATPQETETVFRMLSSAQTVLQDAIIQESEAFLPSTQITDIYQSYELVDTSVVTPRLPNFSLFILTMCTVVLLFVLWLNLFHTYKTKVADTDSWAAYYNKFAVQTRLDVKME